MTTKKKIYDVTFTCDSLPGFVVEAQNYKAAHDVAQSTLDNMKNEDIIALFIDAINYRGCILQNITAVDEGG